MLAGRYDPALVLVSVLVAMFASYTTLALAGRVVHASTRAAAWWIAGGAFAMGTGIWSMHFIGMLAFQLPIPLGYDLQITLLSWALPVAASAVALWQLSRAALHWLRLLASAVLIGAGINAMHYLGMAAMRMQPGIAWDPLLVAASVAIAVAAAGASLWIASRLRDWRGPHLWVPRAAASVVMGLAIVGMHYTGMAAARFPLDSVCLAATGQFTLTQLAVLVIVATLAVLCIALLTSVYDARLEARNQVLALSQQTAQERQVLLDRERAARAEAERLGTVKDEFLATLSHELRTPLHAILGWVQLLRAKHDARSLAKGLDTIERNARLQAQLIDDLLDMSRIVSGKVRLERALLDPLPIAQAAVEAARPTALARDLTISSHLSLDCAPLWGDATRLQQIMWNLLSNAVKFTPAGGRVEVALRCTEGSVVFSVSDSGCGIAPEFLPHVFERFRQADSSTTRHHSGLGLGLAIVRQLVELHGGHVEATSPGTDLGATFTVRLPAAVAHELPVRPRGSGTVAASSQASTLPDLGGWTVLVVDDEPDARQLLHELLTQCGAQVELASDAQEALDALDRRRTDVLLSDIGMPGMDGYALVRRMRAHADPSVARLPAVALSAFASDQDQRRAREAGFDAHIGKPIDVQELAKVLRASRVSATSADPPA
ncbi:MHYT domain-containing protein [Ramlibacter sp. AN1015]|uniref:hybrid sensor histidine kinase/response regulator n=1 Tax=Ramlibacter sp. AN1015 TaxID=3133428 RepID=UPI0030BFF92D